MTNEVEAVQAWLLASYSVKVPNDWLTACVEWIQQENGGQSLGVDQLKPLVFEQWLLSDLRELGAACLPEGLPDMLCTHLTGPLALQVESMLDVGLPLYGQLQKLKGTHNTNSEMCADKPQQPPWEPKPSRMMLLKMTDGQTDVQGMEYKPIPALGSNLQPGVKVVIHGQVKCRRGVLMLTADNVQVLGGEVDSLMEANTPVAVLEHAMELNAKNNGKHARKDFSGRFIKQQDFKSGSQEKKFKVELTTSSSSSSSSALQRQGSGQQCGVWHTGNQRWQGKGGVKNEPQSQSHAWSGGGVGVDGCGVKNELQSQSWNSVKQEPPSQRFVADRDEEWEEDLDYGGLLDEAMDGELPSDVFESSASTITTPQTSGIPANKNPFASEASGTAQPQKSWQGYSSWNTMKSEEDSSGHLFGDNSWEHKVTSRLSARRVECGDFADMVTNYKTEKVSQSVDNAQRENHISGSAQRENQISESAQRGSQGPSLQENSSAIMDEGNWGYDDGFNQVQVESDSLSPVIPVCNLLVQNRQNSDDHMTKCAQAENLLSSSATSVSKPNTPANCVTKSNNVFGKLELKTGANSTASPTHAISKPASPHRSQKSCDDTKPPPAKQQKLTAMFSRVKAESRQGNEGSSPHHLVDTVVDLTEDDTAWSDPNSGVNSVMSNEEGSVMHKKTEQSSTGDVCSLQKKSATMTTMTERAECQDVYMAVERCERGDHQTMGVRQSDVFSQAALPPQISQGELVSSSPSSNVQTLKTVLSALQNDTDSQVTFTIKGYITTLTDRLRSCQGEQWTLACRITDGTAAMEVTIADTVLADLIGFTAQESLTLRQQARKDAGVKDFLTQGLQKCQQYLIEFLGLMDIQRGKGDSKPCLVKMVKQGAKKR